MALCLAMLSGCSLIPTINTSDEDTELVAEYAAGLLVKYNKGHSMGLTRVDDLDISQLYITPTPTPMPVIEIDIVPEDENETETEVNDLTEESDVSNKKPEKEVIPPPPLNEAFGFSNASLELSNIERCDSYPNDDEELLFSMSASEGNDLLIAHFNLTNVSSETQNFMTGLNGYKVRTVINGEEKYRCTFTILPNDMTSFSGNLEAGEVKDVVLVFEVPSSLDIYSMDLMLVNGPDIREYPLYGE